VARKDIPRLLDKVRELVDSPRNQALYELWPDHIEPQAHADFGTYYYWFPTPVNKDGRIPYSLEVEPAFWYKFFNLDLEQFYTDPATYLEFWLRIALYRFEHFHSDTPLTKAIDVDFGSVFVQSLFGVDVMYSAHEGPWVGIEPVWKTETDFAAAKLPDFYESGLSPLAHRFYAEIRELVSEDFRVHFISWRKGPFSLLTHLRGYAQLLIDFYDRPDFVHEMMAFVNEAMKQWYAERKTFTGEDCFGPIYLGNDEVGIPSISPAIYEEFVLPYEIDLSNYFGGIDYWHSCGDTTMLAPLIARIPNIHMFDVGPWTELRPAVEVYKNVPNASIMRRINPVDWVIMANDQQMREPLHEVREVCEGVIPTMVMYDGLNYLEDWKADLEKIHRLDKACHEILHAAP
jgi:uroporphyrinogen-III decarboxylase